MKIAPAPVRVVARVLGWPFKWLGLRGDPRVPPVPRALTALGPAYIKFGQILSTRPDVVGGPRLRVSLQVLQDKLARPFPTDVARRVVGSTRWRNRLGALFTEFSDAGGGGLHRAGAQGQAGRGPNARSPSRFLRPGIERAFRKDIDAFYLIAWVDRDSLAGLPQAPAAGRDRAFSKAS